MSRKPKPKRTAKNSPHLRKHATDDIIEPDETLCGRAVDGSVIDDADPTCRSCLKVIRSRCFDHNVRACNRCPPENRIGWLPDDVN
jgi:hypothetical protein